MLDPHCYSGLIPGEFWQESGVLPSINRYINVIDVEIFIN